MKISRHNLTLPIIYTIFGIGIYLLSQKFIVIGMILTILGGVSSIVSTVAFSILSFGTKDSIVILPWWGSKSIISSDYKRRYRIAFDTRNNDFHIYQELFFGLLLKCLEYDEISNEEYLKEWIKNNIERNELKFNKNSLYQNFNGYINKKDERLNKIDKVL